MNGKVNVLGTEYKIIYNASVKDYDKLRFYAAYCDPSIKTIVIGETTIDTLNIEDDNYNARRLLRHEIVHAYLYESGLAENTEDHWAENEEMVDWIARQFPKLNKTFEELECQK